METKHPVAFLAGCYDKEKFYEMARGLEHVKEGGERCMRCYELRLRESAQTAAQGGFDYFTTTLSISPMKNAAKLNEMGYTAFVLEYRTGFHCGGYAPMQDLARAVKSIEEHHEELNVDPEDYAICGFSAGGNLAGVFGGKEHGYAKYGVRKPGALILGYPWTNVNHWLDHPYWNIWKGLIGIWLSERGLLLMFGPYASRKTRSSLCVQNYITPDYPPTYMMAGSNDLLVPASHHAAVLNQALKWEGVRHVYEQFWGLPHGIGLAVNDQGRGLAGIRGGFLGGERFLGRERHDAGGRRAEIGERYTVR